MLEIPRYVFVGDATGTEHHRAHNVLRKEKINSLTVFEYAPGRDCTVCGIEESLGLLREVLPQNVSEVWAVEGRDGAQVQAGEVVLRVHANVNSFLVYTRWWPASWPPPRGGPPPRASARRPAASSRW